MTQLQCPDDLTLLRDEIVTTRQPDRRWIALCMGTGCRASGSEAVATALRDTLLERRLAAKIDVVEMKRPAARVL